MTISSKLLIVAGLAAASLLPVKNAMANEKLIETKGPQGPLAGEIAGALDGSNPVVLIIPGSGPTNRDGNNPIGILASPYRLLAEGLAAKNIASVRIDKRGMFDSSKAVADGNAVTLDDYADDVKSWISEIQKRNGKKCVWVAGHSEGGLVAILAASRQDNICGLILLATPGRALDELLVEQLNANPANASLMPQAMAAISDLKAGKRHDIKDMNAALEPLFRDEVQGFLISLFAFKPAETLGKVTKPVLIMQGTKDIQVGTKDAERLKAKSPEAKLELLKDVNHVLKIVEGDDVPANKKTYMDPNLPLAAGIVESIAKFIAEAK